MRFFLSFLLTLSVAMPAAAQERCIPDEWEASAETKRILAIEDDAEREAALASRRELINSHFPIAHASVLCMNATSVDYERFKSVGGKLLRLLPERLPADISVTELAYFVDCSKRSADSKIFDRNVVNPLMNNQKLKNLQYTSDGLSETTTELIRDMGPLILEKGPNGQTPLEFVQELHDEVRGHDNLYGVYARIKTFIFMTIDRVGQRCIGE